MINSNGPVTNAVFARLREHKRKAPVDATRRGGFFGHAKVCPRPSYGASR